MPHAREVVAVRRVVAASDVAAARRPRDPEAGLDGVGAALEGIFFTARWSELVARGRLRPPPCCEKNTLSTKKDRLIILYDSDIMPSPIPCVISAALPFVELEVAQGVTTVDELLYDVDVHLVHLLVLTVLLLF